MLSKKGKFIEKLGNFGGNASSTSTQVLCGCGSRVLEPPFKLF